MWEGQVLQAVPLLPRQVVLDYIINQADQASIHVLPWPLL